MGWLRRVWLFVLVFFTSAFWAVGLFFALFVGLVAADINLSERATIGLGVLAILASYMYRFFQISRLIRESNARMSDRRYQMRLRHLGLAP
jgi:membrane protease YdiL (CAAX protease family)